MSGQNENMVNALKELGTTSGILVEALRRNDSEKAHEAVTVLLMQGMELFGPTSVAMQQFFPVFDSIKTRIDAGNLVGALSQTEVFQAQLQEILEMIQR